MTHIFINYNQKKYYLSHIYEHFLYGELLFFKYRPKANIGNGVIYIQTEKDINLQEFKKIAQEVGLKSSYYQTLVNQIQKETLENISEKAACECVNNNVSTIKDLKKVVINSPSQKDFENFGKEILKKNRIIFYGQENKKIYGKKQFKFYKNIKVPFAIKANKNIETNFKTNAKSLIDALLFDYISKKFGSNNYLWLATQKELYLTLKTKTKIQKTNEKTEIAIKNIIYNPENAELDILWQKFDWGSVTDLEKINSKLKKIKKIKVTINKNKINIEY
jgi:hypothetical protein